MKKKIRQQILEKLKLAVDSEEKKKREKLLSDALIATGEWQEAQTVALYASMPHEFDTTSLKCQALLQGKQVVYPKTFSNHEMYFYQINQETKFIKTNFGVMEPVSTDQVSKEQIDLMIVPGVAFQKNGYRIGYGGGFYDRYLSDYHGQTVSLVFPSQLTNDYDFQPEEYDQPVKKIIFFNDKKNMEGKNE